MFLIRFASRLFLILAFVDIGIGIWVWLAGNDVTAAAGETWYKLHSESLNLSQAVIQRYLHPDLWDVLFVPILLRPFWEVVIYVFIVLLVIGGALGFLSRRRRGRDRR